MEMEFEFNITNYCQAKCPTCTRTEILRNDPDSFNLTHMTYQDLVAASKNCQSFQAKVGNQLADQ